MDVPASYKTLLDKAVPLTEIEEFELRNQIAVSSTSQKEELIDKFVFHNLRLSFNCASGIFYKGNYSRCMDLMDVVQLGNIGLLKAANKLDYTGKYKFSTYAVFWIKHEIQRGVHPYQEIAVPHRHNELKTKLKQVSDEKPSKTPLEKLVKKFQNKSSDLRNVSKEAIPNIVQDLTYFSLNNLEDIGRTGWLASGVFDEELGKKLDCEKLNSALNKLTKRERKVIEYRYGFITGKEKRFFREISSAMKIHETKVSEIYQSAKNKLSESMGVNLERQRKRGFSPRILSLPISNS